MSIKRKTAADPISQSADIVADNLDKLKQLFPSVFTEGNIDFEAFRELLGDKVETDPEYYRFTWPGKAMAKAEARKPSRGTLRPAKNESVNWDTTENLYIEGNNLEVLKLLQKSYANKVKMIYIDPPYNTGKDFVYKDNYKDNLANYNQKFNRTDDEGNLKSSAAETNQEGSARYHSNWLNMMYPRLSLARNLLTEDGVIFISIDDHEVDNLNKICNDIFGEENRLTTLIWDTNHSAQAGIFKVYHQYILVFAKQIENISTPRSLNNELFEAGAMKKESSRHPKSKFTFPKGTKFKAEDGVEISGVWGDAEKVKLCDGRMICANGKLKEKVTLEASWTQANQMKEFFYGDKENLVDSRGQKIVDFYFNSSGKIKIVKERSVETPQTTQKFGTQGAISKKLALLFETDESPFDSPKPTEMIEKFCAWFTDSEDIVLDFFGGSSTTAHGVFSANSLQKINRKFILIQLPEEVKDNLESVKLGFEKITELGKERIRLAGKKILEENPEQKDKLDVGFKVFKLDESNIKTWETDPEKLDANLFLEDVIKDDRTEEDVLYEILLKYGLDLTLPIQKKALDTHKLYAIGGGALLVYLGDSATPTIAQEIINWAKELGAINPQAVFRDSGFKNSQDKVNTLQLLKSNNITDVWSI